VLKKDGKGGLLSSLFFLEAGICMPDVGSQLKQIEKAIPLLVGMRVSMGSVIRERPNVLIASSVICYTYKQRLKEHLLET